MAPKIYTQTIYILAPVSKVWNALINPELTKQYMFGCAVISDWIPGNAVTWTGSDGTEYLKGEVIAFESEKKLSYTVFDPNAGYIDDPVNYLTTTFVLSEENGTTRVDVSQGDFAEVENGEKRFTQTFVSWEMTLNKFKHLLEN